jgi:pyruvate dehydrogenase E2 component (dihydrolipoamide acetyltransferase)
MPLTVLMPALSPTMTEGHLVKWHKSVGELVRPGDLLMDVETDKAVMEVEATQGGILARILVPAPAENVKIGHPLAYLKQEGESDEDIPTSAQAQPEGASNAYPPTSAQAQPEASSYPTNESALELEVTSGSFQECSVSGAGAHMVQESVPPISDSSSLPEGRVPVSPLARKLAKQNGLDLTNIKGTGPRGRIVKKDIEQAAHFNSPHRSSSAQSITQAPSKVPLTPMRKVIAQRLSHSKQTIPHFYLSMDCDVDNLLSLRQQLNDFYGDKIFSINDLVVCACARALQAAPDMRLLWGDDCLVQHHQVDLAVAVSISGGLITPIIPDAGNKTPLEISQTLKDLITRARSGKLRADEYQGGTFTVSNLGNIGISHFQPIINPPHSGILAVGSVLSQPIVRNGAVTIGQMMTITLAADHRVVDGSAAAEFLSTLRNFIQNPLSLILK